MLLFLKNIKLRAGKIMSTKAVASKCAKVFTPAIKALRLDMMKIIADCDCDLYKMSEKKAVSKAAKRLEELFKTTEFLQCCEIAQKAVSYSDLMDITLKFEIQLLDKL